MKLEDRFWSKVDKSGDCWIWTANRNAKGYGFFKIGSVNSLAHRVSYDLCVGEIPDGMLCLHRCDNPPCVNPKHLWIGSNQQNMDDMKRKGRQAKGIKNRKALISPDIAKDIRVRYASGERQCDIASDLGVRPRLVHDVVVNRTWVGV